MKNQKLGINNPDFNDLEIENVITRVIELDRAADQKIEDAKQERGRVMAELEDRKKAAEAAQREEDRQRRAERIAAQNTKHKPKRYKLQSKPAPSEPPEEAAEEE